MTDPAAESEEFRLWKRARQGDGAARESLILSHLPYARTVAACYFKHRVHDEVGFDEYWQFAQLGLLQALDRFDPGGGAGFKTFAAHRMRGAILDGIETLSERQQQVAAARRLRAERMESLAKVPGSAGGMFEHLANAGFGLALGYMLEDTGMLQGSGTESRDVDAPYQPLALRQLQRRILELVGELPGSERSVVRAHYLQHRSFDELCGLLGVTKGRVSQIHRRALQRMRERLKVSRRCDLSF